MKVLVFLLFATITFAFSPLHGRAAWIEGSIIGLDADAPKQGPRVWVGNGADETQSDPLGAFGWDGSRYVPSPYRPWQWNTVDLTGQIPPDTKGVFLSSILVITHGTDPQVCGIQVWYRRPGFSAETWRLNSQAVASGVEDGARSPDTQLVPVTDSKYEWWWQPQGTPGWPAGCAYAIATGVVGYVR